MNLGELLRVVGRRWLIIVVFTAVGTGLAVVFAYASKPGYKSQAVLYLDQPGAQGATGSAAMTRLLVLPPTYEYVIESNDIATRASKKLNGAYKPAEIAACVSAKPELATTVIKVSACGDNANDAAQVTTAVVTSFQDWLRERQDANNVLGPNRLDIGVLTAPQIPTSPSGFPPFMWILIGFAGGLLFGLITAFGVESVQTVDEAGAYQPAAPGVPQIGVPPAAAIGQAPRPPLPAAPLPRSRRLGRSV